MRTQINKIPRIYPLEKVPGSWTFKQLKVMKYLWLNHMARLLMIQSYIGISFREAKQLHEWPTAMHQVYLLDTSMLDVYFDVTVALETKAIIFWHRDTTMANDDVLEDVLEDGDTLIIKAADGFSLWLQNLEYTVAGSNLIQMAGLVSPAVAAGTAVNTYKRGSKA